MAAEHFSRDYFNISTSLQLQCSIKKIMKDTEGQRNCFSRKISTNHKLENRLEIDNTSFIAEKTEGS